MFLVLNLYWQEFCRLRDSKKASVCKVGGVNVAKCDALNLGCLLQQFPNLDDPRRTGPSGDETVNSIVAESGGNIERLRSHSFQIWRPQTLCCGSAPGSWSKEFAWVCAWTGAWIIISYGVMGNVPKRRNPLREVIARLVLQLGRVDRLLSRLQQTDQSITLY